MSERFEIRVAGSGGQGVILAAVILGEAAALNTEGLNVHKKSKKHPNRVCLSLFIGLFS